jgi:hypothetical protein
MNRSEARRVVEESLSRPSSTPDYGDADRDSFLEHERNGLRACLIEPIAVRAQASRWAIEHTGLADRPYDLIAVAKSGSCWLLYDPALAEFYKASEGQADGMLWLVGFRSRDALAEWNG